MVKLASIDIYSGFPQNRNLHLSFKTTVKPCFELSLEQHYKMTLQPTFNFKDQDLTDKE